ncbi:DUF58 domain-containing protein [Gracilibacillus dipsosauri]|uniref:DUF58 domain-containing protein n=1 Tax=Gracilibacillus dipsosauri TaxID=178340 RepID=UPI0024091CD2
MKSTMHRIRKIIQLLLLSGVLFAFAMFQGGFVSWFLFYSVVPLLIYMLSIPFYPFNKWRVNRVLSSKYGQAGGSVLITITLERKIPFPLFYLVVEENSPTTLNYQDIGQEKYKYLNDQQFYVENRVFRKLLFPLFKRKLTVTFRVANLPRGQHSFHSINVQTGDPFGLISNQYVWEIEDSLVVYPAVRSLEWKQRMDSNEAGANPVLLHDHKQANVVSGVREYIPGDRFSWIDWKTTARKNSIMTKEFEQEKDAHMAIVLSTELKSSMQQLSFEALVELAASILVSTRKKGQSVSFHMLGEAEKHFTEQQVKFEPTVIQNYLALINPDKKASLFTSKLVNSLNHLPKGSLLLCITSQLDQKLVDSLVIKSKQDLQIALYSIISKNDYTSFHQSLIESLRMHRISVQILSEDDLKKVRWEVNASL